MKDSLNILVVDDESRVQNILEHLLETYGHIVRSVGKARSALKYLESNRVDLVISDIRMPVMSGFDLLKEIKLRYPDVAVIMMTGYNDSYSIREAFRLGADEYITKPFKAHELSLIIERVCWRLFSGDIKSKTAPAKKTAK